MGSEFSGSVGVAGTARLVLIPYRAGVAESDQVPELGGVGLTRAPAPLP
jgi:hypothetical protein